MKMRNKYYYLGLVLSAGILVSSVLFLVMYKWEREKIKSIFHVLVSDRANIIEDTANDNISLLQSISDFFAASQKVERNEFHIFCRGIISRHPSVFEFRWLSRVLDSERQSFEEAGIREGLRDFYIKEINKDEQFVCAGRREEYFPIYYIEFLESHTFDHSLIFGLDAASIPERWQAMQKARDAGLPCTTGEIRYIGEANIKSASRVFFPIYRNNFPHDTPEERRENLAGFVVLLYRVNEMIEYALRRVSAAEIDICVYEETERGEEFIYSTKGKNINIEAIRKNDFLIEHSFNVADHRWNVYCTPTVQFLHEHKRWIAQVVFFVGILLTGILVVYFYSLIARSAKIEGLVMLRTEELGREKEGVDILNNRLREKMNDIQERDQKLFDSSEELKAMNEELASSKDEIESALNQVEAQRGYIQSERDRLEIILEQMGEGLLVINQKNEIEFINNRAKEILGYAGKADIPNGYKKFFILQLWKEIHESKTGIVRKELTLQRPKEVILLITLVRLSDEGRGTKDEGRGFVAVFRDITIEKRIEKMKSDFVANVSHEIRSPMAPMKDALSLVLDGTAGPLTESQQKFLSILSTNMERLTRLINDLLDLSKIEAGGMELKKETVDISALVKDTVESIRVYATKKGLNLSIIDEGKPLKIECDRDRIVQVVINLVMNAIKFTPEGGSITVETRIHTDESTDIHGLKSALIRPESVEIRVSDTGPGMTPDEADALFNRFKQLASPEKVKGTGLGLAISKAIIEMHGGKIWVESEPDKGSKFVVTLPVT